MTNFILGTIYGIVLSVVVGGAFAAQMNKEQIDQINVYKSFDIQISSVYAASSPSGKAVMIQADEEGHVICAK